MAWLRTLNPRTVKVNYMATATEAKTKPAVRKPGARTTEGASSSARSERPPRREESHTTEDYAGIADEVLAQVVTGGQSAIGATRRFVKSVDEALAGSEEEPTRVHEIVDGALEMSDRLVESGGDAIRGIVRGIAPSSK